jgi:hypothetical protein
MRLVKIPYDQGDEGDEGDLDMARVHKAERRFLESLEAEAKRPVEPRRRGRAVKVTPRSGRAAGRGLGSAYAALNSNSARDIDRPATFVSAIKQGVNEAARRDARDAALLDDPAHLEEMGFTGFGPQSDDF